MRAWNFIGTVSPTSSPSRWAVCSPTTTVPGVSASREPCLHRDRQRQPEILGIDRGDVGAVALDRREGLSQGGDAADPVDLTDLVGDLGGERRSHEVGHHELRGQRALHRGVGAGRRRAAQDRHQGDQGQPDHQRARGGRRAPRVAGGVLRGEHARRCRRRAGSRSENSLHERAAQPRAEQRDTDQDREHPEPDQQQADVVLAHEADDHRADAERDQPGARRARACAATTPAARRRRRAQRPARSGRHVGRAGRPRSP